MASVRGVCCNIKQTVTEYYCQTFLVNLDNLIF